MLERFHKRNKKNQLTMTINFVFSKDTDDEYVMHSKSDNIEIEIE